MAELTFFPAYAYANPGDLVTVGGKSFMYVPVSSRYGAGKYIAFETRDPNTALDEVEFIAQQPVVANDFDVPTGTPGETIRTINHRIDLKTIDPLS